MEYDLPKIAEAVFTQWTKDGRDENDFEPKARDMFEQMLTVKPPEPDKNQLCKSKPQVYLDQEDQTSSLHSPEQSACTSVLPNEQCNTLLEDDL